MMQEEKNRLLRYALLVGHEGNWLANGEDCIPALNSLQSDGLIERDETGKKWRLIIG